MQISKKQLEICKLEEEIVQNPSDVLTAIQLDLETSNSFAANLDKVGKFRNILNIQSFHEVAGDGCGEVHLRWVRRSAKS